jgi:hypothetical protein
VARFVDNAHPALAQPPLELVPAVENWIALNRLLSLSPIVRTIHNVVGKADTTGWTLSHSVISIKRGSSESKGIRRRILAAEWQASKQKLFHHHIY